MKSYPVLTVIPLLALGFCSSSCTELNPTYNANKWPLDNGGVGLDRSGPGLEAGTPKDFKVLPGDLTKPPPKKDSGPIPKDTGLPKKDKTPPPPPDLLRPLVDKAVPVCVGLSCPLGCNKPQNRCYRLKPSNYDVKASYQQATAGLSVSGKATIDTTNGQIMVDSKVVRQANKLGLHGGIYWERKSQGAGYPGLSIFVLKSLEVDKGALLTVTGADALAIYATGNIKVVGNMSASGSGLYAGAGGGAGGKSNGASGAACFTGHGLGGNQAGQGNNQVEAGGGGGGRLVAGGKGGDSSYYAKPKGGAGGLANGNKTLTPLYGGCGGGAGGGPDTAGVAGGAGGYGGGGGGAIQLSANGQVTISGRVVTGGAGGEGGHGGGGGGGGGSGGAIMMEAISFTHAGFLTANGGGGGSGSGSATYANSYDGESGRSDSNQASGAAAHGPYGGAGGKGGALSPPSGGNGAANANGGGGGGAAGIVRINSHKAPVVSGVISPGHTSGKIAVW